MDEVLGAAAVGVGGLAVAGLFKGVLLGGAEITPKQDGTAAMMAEPGETDVDGDAGDPVRKGLEGAVLIDLGEDTEEGFLDEVGTFFLWRAVGGDDARDVRMQALHGLAGGVLVPLAEAVDETRPRVWCQGGGFGHGGVVHHGSMENKHSRLADEECVWHDVGMVCQRQRCRRWRAVTDGEKKFAVGVTRRCDRHLGWVKAALIKPLSEEIRNISSPYSTSMKHHPILSWLLISCSLAAPAMAQTYPAFNPIISTTINADTADRADGTVDGIIHYSSYTVRAGRRVRYVNSVNPQHPVIIHVTGPVSIQGIVDVSGNTSLSTRNPGPGGYPGGAAGLGIMVGQPGQGDGAGFGGGVPTNIGLPDPRNSQGNAGGGGGYATHGLMATSRTGHHPGAGGFPMSRRLIYPLTPGAGGAGGGGGSGRMVAGVTPVKGGIGGGGGGAIRIQSDVSITIGAAVANDLPLDSCGIWARGADGGVAYGNGLDIGSHAGPGGGGAGGAIELSAPFVQLLHGTLLTARGGFGGGISSQPVSRDPEYFSCGAHGGEGYVFFDTLTVYVQPGVVSYEATLTWLQGASLIFNQ